MEGKRVQAVTASVRKGRMMYVYFEYEGSPIVRCLSEAGPLPEAYSSYRGDIEPRPLGRLGTPDGGTEVARKEGVHNVHTLGCGWGLTGAGLGRIAEVFGGVAGIQGLESGSSPTSGTVFSLFRACGPLTVHKFCCVVWAPTGYWWPGMWPAASLPT
jgi:hypothetical protein